MKRVNCWEVKKYGREKGGENDVKFGICPAAQHSQYDGVNNGEYAGRFCWAVAGTFCGDQVQGSYAKKLITCITCNFLKQVHIVEDRHSVLTHQEIEDNLI